MNGDHGAVKTFWGVDQGWAVIGEGGSGPLTLREWRPPEWATWFGYLFILTPIQRRMGGGDYDLLRVAIAMVEEKGHWSDKRAPIRWIVGNDPLVVAIGTEEEDVRVDSGAGISEGIGLGGTYHVVAKADLDRQATELIVLQHWPSRWPVVGQGGDPEEDLRSELKAEGIVRRIQLPGPTPLHVIMQEMPKTLKAKSNK